MTTFLVWNPDDCDAEDARPIIAYDPTVAAVQFVERHDRDDWDDGQCRTYHVRDEEGRTVAVSVSGETTWTYRAGVVGDVEESR